MSVILFVSIFPNWHYLNDNAVNRAGGVKGACASKTFALPPPLDFDKSLFTDQSIKTTDSPLLKIKDVSPSFLILTALHNGPTICD